MEVQENKKKNAEIVDKQIKVDSYDKDRQNIQQATDPPTDQPTQYAQKSQQPCSMHS